jgi:hypothetical protein
MRAYTSPGDIDLTIGYQGYSEAKGDQPLPTVWICFTGGALEVTDMSGENTIIPSDYAGIPIPGQFKAIEADNTTATSLLVMWGGKGG